MRDGVPYAIDFMNPVPDFDPNNLGPRLFDWVVSRMSDLIVRRARENAEGRPELVWPLQLGQAFGRRSAAR